MQNDVNKINKNRLSMKLLSLLKMLQRSELLYGLFIIVFKLLLDSSSGCFQSIVLPWTLQEPSRHLFKLSQSILSIKLMLQFSTENIAHGSSDFSLPYLYDRTYNWRSEKSLEPCALFSV